MRAVIFTGGECLTSRVAEWLSPTSETIFHTGGERESRKKESFVIAADSGYDTAISAGVIPDLIVGDMDSIRHPLPEGAEMIRVRAEKDETDTMLAIHTALERGADQITVIGGAGGRADHWLSNIFMLEHLIRMGINAELWDGINRITAVHNSTLTVKAGCSYFGIIALEDSTVSAEGCRYPLNKAHLKRDCPYAVSNEVTGSSATITVNGCVIVTASYI